MSAREEILGRLGRGASRSAPTPPGPWASRRTYTDLAAQFEQALTAVAGEVIRANNLEDALDQVTQILADLGAKRVVINGDLFLSAAQRALLDAPERECFQVGEDDGDLRAICAQADVGLSGAEAALAETGSVVILSGPTKSRLATLLPPVHIALVPTSCLTADIFTWTAARQGTMPANVTLVSGPSKTADIEQVLAIGVHGPKRFIAVLYEV